MKRREFIAATAALLASPRVLRAQGTLRRIGCFGILENAEREKLALIVWVHTVLLALLLPTKARLRRAARTAATAERPCHGRAADCARCGSRTA